MSSTAISVPGSSALIVPATWRDLTALRHLEQVCFIKDAWPLLDIIGVLTLPSVVRMKAVTGEQMIGFVAADVRSKGTLAWIATICVHPDYQGKGIGRALLRVCEERLDVPRIHLSVRSSNLGAINFYQLSGYQQIGVWSHYYQEGENALVMEKQL